MLVSNPIPNNLSSDCSCLGAAHPRTLVLVRPIGRTARKKGEQQHETPALIAVGAALAAGFLTASAAGAAAAEPYPTVPSVEQDITKGSRGRSGTGRGYKGASGQPMPGSPARLAPANDNFAFATVPAVANNSISREHHQGNRRGRASRRTATSSVGGKQLGVVPVDGTGNRPGVFRTIGSNFDTVMAAYRRAPGRARV